MEIGACAENDDEVVLCTQPVAAPLNGVVALVDVRGQCENRFRGIAREVEKLGGKAVSRFTSDITHVIFQNGKTHVKEKADKKGIPVVSVLWLESCRQTGEIASEAKYPVIYNESTPVILGKLKRMKSMQPKSFDEQLSRSIERAKQRRVKGMQKATYHSPALLQGSKFGILVFSYPNLW
ncbi:microcephalin-like isoform X2 [Corticium candelabrum]|uniref:microcephalin-like isoform X2 n=1 Tax=Corticium candelabrum TaxID=121492 RepID=UPI002E271BD4|nr:microcephalin-like isoform X2 [Corticium candelabrum]